MSLKTELDNIGVLIEPNGPVMKEGDSFAVYLKNCHQITWDPSVSIGDVALKIAEKSKHIQPWPLLLPEGVDKAEIEDWDGIPVRYIEQYEIVDNKVIKRYDIAFRSLDVIAEEA